MTTPPDLVEIMARAIASEDLSLAFMEPHPMESSLAARCRDADREKAFRIAHAALAALEARGSWATMIGPKSSPPPRGNDMLVSPRFDDERTRLIIYSNGALEINGWDIDTEGSLFTAHETARAILEWAIAKMTNTIDPQLG